MEQDGTLSKVITCCSSPVYVCKGLSEFRNRIRTGGSGIRRGYACRVDDGAELRMMSHVAASEVDLEWSFPGLSKRHLPQLWPTLHVLFFDHPGQE